MTDKEACPDCGQQVPPGGHRTCFGRRDEFAELLYYRASLERNFTRMLWVNIDPQMKDVWRKHATEMRPSETTDLKYSCWDGHPSVSYNASRCPVCEWKNSCTGKHGSQAQCVSAVEPAEEHEDKADLLSMAALVARIGRDQAYSVPADLLKRASAVLVALAETRVTRRHRGCGSDCTLPAGHLGDHLPPVNGT